MITFLAPWTAAKVRRMRSSRAGVRTYHYISVRHRVYNSTKRRRTCIQTSSGSACSLSARTNPKSVSLAAGYATSISLKPHTSSLSKNAFFCSIVIGFANAWLPSRRSVESHIGPCWGVFDGHWRLGSWRGVYGRIFYRRVISKHNMSYCAGDR